MGILPRSKKKDELVLVFDIGSSSVKAALFYMQQSGIPRIITTLREPILLEENISIERFLASTIQALENVAGQMYKKGLGAPERIFCILSSPWHISQTRVIQVQKDIPFVFTSRLADSLIQKEVALVKEEYVKKYPIGDALRPIELKNIKVMLNGYETANPIGKKAVELQMTIYISMGPEEMLKRIEKTVVKYFSSRKTNSRIKFSSFTMAVFAIVRDMYAHQENFLLINVGGEITDITLVKKNALHESTSFPLGINFMIRRVGGEMRCTLAEAKSLISLFKDGHAEATTETRLLPVIAGLKSEWLRKFQETLANLSNDISIPASIYITVDKDLADFFSEIIKTEQFNQYTLTESKFQIIFLNIQNLHGIAIFDQDAIFNAFLTIDSSYINRSFH